ncbi:hypothetical protein L6470_02715 [Prevotella communis]|uniref:hypothetical protein n=1 Tax=Prevotella communis TaxID=2913614 RepID=UPI001EDB3CD8|nr:hypothetical protein [Prevotella communis]UKK59939.1 hypothetical protein L6470_02715 [Prevotella communis]
MRKTYMMLLALVLTMLGVSDAMAQKIYRAELDKSMFKAWTSDQPGATEVENPEAIDVSDENPNGTPFSCDNNLYKEIGSWSGIFGNTAAYYLWYADITGTKKMYFKGTPGFKFYVQFNRQAPEEGGDAHGGAMVQQELTIGDDGTATYDIPESMTYVHLNCIKTKGIDGTGILKGMEIEGTVKPVTGILSMINNGDAEGDDLLSFPVSWDGPNNNDSAPDSPEIVEGGVDGSKCFKVTAFAEPTQTWHSQFYIKADEVMPKGTKWKLKMAIKASKESHVTTSAQGQPRQWKGGMINEFTVGTEWTNYEWSGEIGVDDFQSIAFDLNNGDERNADDNGWLPGNGGTEFFFDNIEFGIDLGGSNPLSSVSAASGNDVVRIDLGGTTNMKELVAASPLKTLVFDNSTVTLTVDGEPFEDIVSVEGYSDGNLYIFLEEDLYAENKVKVAFTNPEDDAHRLLFATGKWEGEAVPDFSGMEAPFDVELANAGYVSYLYGEPEMVKIDPENGSFNLSNDVKAFTVTFNQPVLVSSVVAKLGSEALTASGDDEYSKVITLTRTSDAALTGAVKLVISAAEGKAGDAFGLANDIVVNYSYGPVSLDGDDQPAVIYTSNFAREGVDANGAGWYVNAGTALQPAGSDSGCRIMHDQGAFSNDLVYIAQRDAAKGGVAVYGIDDDYKLALEAGKTYHVTLKACRHDRTDVALRVQVLPEAAVSTEDGSLIDSEAILAEDFQAITPEKSSKLAVNFDLAVTPSEAGNFVIRLVPSKENGSFAGYDDPVCFGDVKVEYIPNVMGIVETKALQTALADAKNTRDTNNGERYAGEAFTALDNLVKEVEANMGSYYAPSTYAKKTEELNETAKALTDHVALCDEYDKLPQQAFDLWVEKKESKFIDTEYFKNLVTIVNKYCTYGDETTFNEDTQEEVTTLVLKDFVKYYTTAELNTAKKELSDVITMASKWLTEGPSTKGWNQITTGYAALHERIRRGVELLKSLGVADDDPLIVQADAELGDNDEIADAIAFRAKSIILEDLAKGEESTLFAPAGDEGETPAYDLSVFFKNPNCYGPANSTEVPGWTSVAGNGFAWSSWDGAQNHSANTPYPEDCDIHAGWHPNPYAMVEQTVTELPVGTYVVTVKCNDNGNSWNAATDENPGSGTCAFVRTSANPAIESGAEVDREVDFAAYLTGSGDFGGEDGITIEDGQLTVGFYYGNTSQAFFEEITSVKLIAPLAGHDYKKDQETSIETAAAPSVRSILVYDLNGRRVIKANKGLQIVKKQMSDGSVRVEKVVK